MKKINIYIGLILIAFAFSSCEEDLDIWDSKTLDYSGTYFWELYSEDMSSKYIEYDHSIQLLIYNTSDNINNQMWFEDTDHIFPLKSKFVFDGTPEAFKSSSEGFQDLPYNILSIDELPTPAPTGLNQETTENRDYIKSSILEGKILKNAGTTVSGNPVDSIYVKIKLFSGTATYISEEVPIELRADPEVEEFRWIFDSSTYDNSLDEVYILSGHRKTGFAEDDH